MSRCKQHRIEDIAEGIVSLNIKQAGSLYRKLPGRDYGIDGIIELFEDEQTTGKFILVQIKGSKTKYGDDPEKTILSCTVRQTTFQYVRTSNLPVVLVAVDTSTKTFYYGLLSELNVVNMNVQEPTVHLERQNSCGEDEKSFVEWLKELKLTSYIRASEE